MWPFDMIGDGFSLFREVKNYKADQERQKLLTEMKADLWGFQQSMMVAIEKSLLHSHLDRDRLPTNGFASGSASLLSVRQEHFAEEKEMLCRRLVDEVARRAKTEQVLLLLDAGSTVLPVFRQLCEHPAFVESTENCQRVQIVTNNLGGVALLLRHGTVGTAVSAKTRFRCFIAEGEVNSTYEACLGETTADSVTELVSKWRDSRSVKSGSSAAESKAQPSGTAVLAIVTGNYVSISDGILARGEEHIKVKQAMMDCADECFLVAPMGKLLPCTCSQLNHVLSQQREFERRSYETVPSKPNQIPKLVYTYRPKNYANGKGLYALKRYFDDINDHVKSRSNGTVYTITDDWRMEINPFDIAVSMRIDRQLMGEEHAIWTYEFPHPPMQKIMKERIVDRRTGIAIDKLFPDPPALPAV